MNAEAIPLLYKFGYLAKAGERLKLTSSLRSKLPFWREHFFNGLSLFAHPDLPIAFSTHNNNNVVILGHAFNPFSKVLDSQLVCDKLANFKEESSAFFEEIDELSGRFIVFAKFDEVWRAYPDGFSSKMRYFTKELNPTLSSHVNLLAEATGSSIDFDMYAFITSEAYKKKDVKNLPGLKTEYENVFVAPANHSLRLDNASLSRFWPRGNICHKDTELASNVLISYLDGYSDYIAQNFDEEIFGLTGGMDSRTMLAPLIAKGVKLNTFTQLRGSQSNLADLKAAKSLAEKFNFSHRVIDVSSQDVRVNGYFSESRKALRTNGGPHRLNTIFSTDALYNAFKDLTSRTNYSRGFGGEILRGFHQRNGKKLKVAEAEHFSRIMAIHTQTAISIDSFSEHIEMLDYNNCCDADLYDLFYMEHRMSKWGANSMNETDVAVHTMVGFNSRKLYASSMGLPLKIREKRNAFRDSVNYFCKELFEVDIV